MGDAVEQAARERAERAINHEVRQRFADGCRAVLLEHGDDPAVGPGQLLVRVFIPAPAAPTDYAGVLAAWQAEHQASMDMLRRELSLRLPSARLLEFTFDDPGPEIPRITLPDDPAQGAPRLSGREIVTSAMSLLRAHYVFPEAAKRAAAAVEARMAAGEYDDLDEITLTGLLTGHLRELVGDKHLRLELGGPPPDREPGSGAPDNHEARRLAARQAGRLDNFGIRRVERLDGNIGYLDVRRVAVPANAGPAIAAAMELVAGTYALILDLRSNGGGSPDGVAFWCSYLFPEDEPIHLNDILDPGAGETRQFWALPYVPGTRYTARPVYALTSERTFSGGEELCYNLQALGRAELIGETTGGGAHPVLGFPVGGGVLIRVPHRRSVNPVTGTNWEGTGVTPDVAVPAAAAHDVAYAKALRHVLALPDASPSIVHEARDALASLAPRT